MGVVGYSMRQGVPQELGKVYPPLEGLYRESEPVLSQTLSLAEGSLSKDARVKCVSFPFGLWELTPPHFRRVKPWPVCACLCVSAPVCVQRTGRRRQVHRTGRPPPRSVKAQPTYTSSQGLRLRQSSAPQHDAPSLSLTHKAGIPYVPSQ